MRGSSSKSHKSTINSDGQVKRNSSQANQEQILVSYAKDQQIYNDGLELSNRSMRQRSKCQTFCHYLPQIICVSIFAGVIIFCIIDFHKVTKMFNQFIAWVRVNPYPAIGASVLLYTISIVFTLPITQNHIMLAYTYSQVFQNGYYGFIFTVPIILIGILSGALCAFLVSRYLFKNFVKQQINESEWLSNNFRAINELLSSQGTVIIALLRLTFAPFGITSHLFGVTSIGLCQFMMGTCSYIVNILMQAFIGCSLYIMQKDNEVVDDKQKRTEYIIFSIELILTICITAIMGYYANQMVQDKLEQFANEQQEQKEETESMRLLDEINNKNLLNDENENEIHLDVENSTTGSKAKTAA